MTPWGLARASTHQITLPATDTLPELALDISWAPAPSRAHTRAPPLVLYVLDPEPILFAAAALFAYSTFGYFSALPSTAEHGSGRLHVIGVGHAASEFSASPHGWDNCALRQLRRRDFPPFEHPSIRAGRAANACSTRFVTALIEHVIPDVEGRLLGSSTRPRRALLGASYSAVIALQVLQLHPAAFEWFVLGSPSVCFDPEILDTLAQMPFPPHDRTPGVFIAIGAEERELLPADGDTRASPRAGNVHLDLPSGAEDLARILRDRKLEVDGLHEIEREDHTSMKLALVSRGLMWLLRRVHEAPSR
ncbi:hypothetical protein AB1Y20_007250 [Prymnesium parvum]|uniref:S-formylglutathione hydrolase n=1 Tax=Prymnesium parvum TaxID=97485 RepID=A0AB34IU04_PRYPA